jgi:hypothetical protein
VCIQFVQQEHFDDVDSSVMDELINKGNMLLDGLEKAERSSGSCVPEIKSMIATTERRMTRTVPVLRANREFWHASMHVPSASSLAKNLFQVDDL